MGSKMPVENYSGVLQRENCCAVGTEDDSGTLWRHKENEAQWHHNKICGLLKENVNDGLHIVMGWR